MMNRATAGVSDMAGAALKAGDAALTFVGDSAGELGEGLATMFVDDTGLAVVEDRSLAAKHGTMHNKFVRVVHEIMAYATDEAAHEAVQTRSVQRKMLKTGRVHEMAGMHRMITTRPVPYTRDPETGKPRTATHETDVARLCWGDPCWTSLQDAEGTDQWAELKDDEEWTEWNETRLELESVTRHTSEEHHTTHYAKRFIATADEVPFDVSAGLLSAADSPCPCLPLRVC